MAPRFGCGAETRRSQGVLAGWLWTACGTTVGRTLFANANRWTTRSRSLETLTSLCLAGRRHLFDVLFRLRQSSSTEEKCRGVAKVEVTQFTRFQRVDNRQGRSLLLQAGKLCGIETSKHQNGNLYGGNHKELVLTQWSPPQNRTQFSSREAALVLGDRSIL